jgi:hypothetical protein
MTRSLTLVVAALVLAFPLTAAAQWPRPPRPRPPPPSPELLEKMRTPPAVEIGVHAGLWNLDGSESLGMRISRNVKPYLAWEASVERGAWSADRRGYALAFANVRAQVRAPEDRGWLFMSLGAGTGSGLSYDDVSPMAAVGYQSDWAGGVVALRVELQRFLHGTELRDRGRLLFGMAIGIR